MSARAQADNQCNTAQGCFNAAPWERGVADDYQNKGVFFREYSKHYFVQAYEWNQKATFAFHAGDGNAAVWYKAIADDYSQKSVANAKAADAHFAQAAFWREAANTSILRGFFIAGGIKSAADYPADPGDVDADCTTGDYCTAGQKKRCKRHPLDNYWHPRVAGADVYRAHVYTMWCFRNYLIVSRKTTTDDHHITPWGRGMGYEIDFGPDEKRNYCKPDRSACFTRFQYGFRGVPLQTAGGCIETWIFGSGYHHRDTYGGDCKSDWPI